MRKPLYKLRAKTPGQIEIIKVAVLEISRQHVRFYPFYPEKKILEIEEMSFHAFNEKYILDGFQK
jgi:hypothetical protein